MLGRLLPETALWRRVVKSASGGKEEKKNLEKKISKPQSTHSLTHSKIEYLLILVWQKYETIPFSSPP